MLLHTTKARVLRGTRAQDILFEREETDRQWTITPLASPLPIR